MHVPGIGKRFSCLTALYCSLVLGTGLVFLVEVQLLQPQQKLTEETKPVPVRFLTAVSSKEAQVTEQKSVESQLEEEQKLDLTEEEKQLDLRTILKRLGHGDVWKPEQRDEGIRLLENAVRRDHTEWLAAIKGFKSDDVHRGRVPGDWALEHDKVLLERTVRRFQRELGSCGGPLITPFTFPLQGDSLEEEVDDKEKQDRQEEFCRRATSSCGQKEPFWVIKPKGGTAGAGVHKRNLTGTTTSRCTEDLGKGAKTQIYLAQRLIDNPLLVDGLKVEVRFHVLIANTKPWLVMYHPDFVVKQASNTKTLAINTHQQTVQSLSPEDLVSKIGGGDEALALIRGQLNRIARVVVTAHRSAGGFGPTRRDHWGVYGLDVALTRDLRAHLLDWNVMPGLGMSVSASGGGSQRQSTVTVHDMYLIALNVLKGKSGKELSTIAKSTTWLPVIDEASDDSKPMPRVLPKQTCTGKWHEGIPGSVELFNSWESADNTFLECMQ